MDGIKKENKMGTQPINKLIISMSLPMVISMLVQALYNFVDGVFVAQISENAMTAVTLAFPMQMLTIAVGIGLGVGMNAHLSKSLGEHNKEEANRAAMNGYFLAAIAFVVTALLGGFFSRAYFASQTDIAEIVNMGTDYLFICTVFSFGVYFQFIGERALQSTGKTLPCMVSQGVGAIVNLIFDPILIFGMFGLPALGIKGAAIATVMGQIVAMILAFIFNKKYNHEVQFKFSGFKPSGYTIKKILIVGVPTMFMQSVGSIMTVGMNSILLTFSTTATAIFGIYFKIQSLFIMPVLGMTNALVPIISYNYGAKNKKRLIETIKLGCTYGVCVMLVALVIFQLFPAQILLIFKADENMLSIGVTALRVMGLSYIFAGFCIVCGSVFQALGKAVNSLIVSVSRQLLVLLPVAYIFAITFNDVSAVWWSFPIAEIMSVGMSTFLLIKVFKSTINVLD